MIPITAAMQTALAAPAKDMVHLMQFNFATGTQRYVTWGYPVTWAGDTWQPGGGGAVDLPTKGVGADADAASMSLIVSAIDPTRLANAVNQSRWRRFIWRIGVLNTGKAFEPTQPADSVVRDPITWLVRWMIPGPITSAPGGVLTVEIRLEPFWAPALVSAPRVRSHADQLAVDATDDCFIDAGLTFKLDRTEFVVKSGLT